jgi:hypothetical protein
MPIQQRRTTPWKYIISSTNSKHFRELEESWSCWQDPNPILKQMNCPHRNTHTHTGTTVFPSNTGTVILSPHLGLSAQTIAFLHGLRGGGEIVWIFILSRAFYIPCPSQIPRLGHLNNVEWRSSSLCSFLHSPITSCILGPHILFSQYSKTFVLRDKPILLRRWSITEVAVTHPWRRKQKYVFGSSTLHLCCTSNKKDHVVHTHIPNTNGGAQACNFTDRGIRNVIFLVVKLYFHSLVGRVKTGTTALQS